MRELKPCSLCGANGMFLSSHEWVSCSNEDCPASFVGHQFDLWQNAEWGKRYKWDEEKKEAVYIGGADDEIP